MNYNTYPPEIKYIVAKIKDQGLCKDFGIPRKTAKHWIEKGADENTQLSTEYSLLLAKITQLQIQLEREKQLRRLFEKVKRIAPLNNELEKVVDPVKREKVINAIKDAKKHAPLIECLRIIGLTKSTYYRWTSEFSPKINALGGIIRKSSNQLTDQEIFKLKEILTAKKYLHFPIASLHYYMLRTRELICSMQTWYRYLKLLGIKRWNQLGRERMKNNEEGIRATYPNELWHIDVTQVKLKGGKKAYVQVVVDNYSRYVLAWKVTDNIGALSTIKTLREAHKKTAEFGIETGVVMDGGGENIGAKVEDYIYSKNFKRLIAQVDIESSNSLVEALFRSMKNNYLYHHDIRSITQLKYRVGFYLNQHNQVIPHSAFRGATPEEIYKNRWNERREHELKILIQRRADERREENRIADLLCMQVA